MLVQKKEMIQPLIMKHFSLFSKGKEFPNKDAKIIVIIQEAYLYAASSHHKL